MGKGRDEDEGKNYHFTNLWANSFNLGPFACSYPKIFTKTLCIWGISARRNKNGEEAQGIVRTYKIFALSLTLILLAGLLGLIYIDNSILLPTVYISLCPFAYIIPLQLANNKVKSLADNEGVKDPSSRVLISTDLAQDKVFNATGLVPIYGFGLILIILTSLIILFNYDKFPNKLVMHVGFDGKVGRIVDKSYWSLLTPSMISLLFWAIFLISNIVYLKSKQVLSPDMPEKSLKRLVQARRIWTFYYGGLALGLILMCQFGLPHFMVTGKSGPILIITTIICVLAIVLQILLASRVGVDGSKLEDEPGYVFTGDEKNWPLAGLVYYNPEDPAVFVYRRLGAGVTINLATFLGKLFAFIFIFIPLLCLLILVIFRLKTV